MRTCNAPPSFRHFDDVLFNIHIYSSLSFFNFFFYISFFLSFLLFSSFFLFFFTSASSCLSSFFPLFFSFPPPPPFRKRSCTALSRRIGEYISIDLFYFVNLTRSCSLIPCSEVILGSHSLTPNPPLLVHRELKSPN